MRIRKIPLPHYNNRPKGVAIDTIVIHSMYAKGTSTLFSLRACAKILDRHSVAAHYLIDKRGTIASLVPDKKRAWHAGVSKMPFTRDSRENVNDFSIGIEVIGIPYKTFAPIQYRTLAQLTSKLLRTFPIKNIVGHSAIAPGRKVDPGRGFSWRKYIAALKRENVKIESLRFK